MALTLDEVRRVAALARLQLTADEEQLYAVQLGRIVEYIDQLGRFEIGLGDEMSLPAFDAADEPRPGLPLSTVLANAPESRSPFVVVPQVLGGDD